MITINSEVAPSRERAREQRSVSRSRAKRGGFKPLRSGRDDSPGDDHELEQAERLVSARAEEILRGSRASRKASCEHVEL